MERMLAQGGPHPHIVLPGKLPVTAALVALNWPRGRPLPGEPGREHAGEALAGRHGLLSGARGRPLLRTPP